MVACARRRARRLARSPSRTGRWRRATTAAREEVEERQDQKEQDDPEGDVRALPKRMTPMARTTPRRWDQDKGPGGGFNAKRRPRTGWEAILGGWTPCRRPLGGLHAPASSPGEDELLEVSQAGGPPAPTRVTDPSRRSEPGGGSAGPAGPPRPLRATRTSHPPSPSGRRGSPRAWPPAPRRPGGRAAERLMARPMLAPARPTSARPLGPARLVPALQGPRRRLAHQRRGQEEVAAVLARLPPRPLGGRPVRMARARAMWPAVRTSRSRVSPEVRKAPPSSPAPAPGRTPGSSLDGPRSRRSRAP
jgi:hypothetical protein